MPHKLQNYSFENDFLYMDVYKTSHVARPSIHMVCEFCTWLLGFSLPFFHCLLNEHFHHVFINL